MTDNNILPFRTVEASTQVQLSLFDVIENGITCRVCGAHKPTDQYYDRERNRNGEKVKRTDCKSCCRKSKANRKSGNDYRRLFGVGISGLRYWCKTRGIKWTLESAPLIALDWANSKTKKLDDLKKIEQAKREAKEAREAKQASREEDGTIEQSIYLRSGRLLVSVSVNGSHKSQWFDRHDIQGAQEQAIYTRIKTPKDRIGRECKSCRSMFFVTNGGQEYCTKKCRDNYYDALNVFTCNECGLEKGKDQFAKSSDGHQTGTIDSSAGNADQRELLEITKRLSDSSR